MGEISFKIEDEPTVVAASRLVIAEGLQPHRVVLRMLRGRFADIGEWVVHMENMRLDGDTFRHRDFYWGHYFGNDEANAREYFQKRQGKL